MVSSKWLKEVVGGWEINGIFTAASGTPFNVTTGFNNSNDGDTNSPDRPNLNAGFNSDPITGTTGAGCTVGGVTVGPNLPLGTAAHWFNPCAYSLPTAGFFGDLPRDSATGPNLITLNSTLARTFSITERMKLELRGEFYNLFNRANLAIPGTTGVFTSARAFSPTAGEITATRIPNRQTQIGLKLTF